MALKSLIVGADLPHRVFVGEVSFRRIGVGAVEDTPDLLQADPVLVQGRRIQLDADARQSAPSHDHLAHAAHLCQLLRHDR